VPRRCKLHDIGADRDAAAFNGSAGRTAQHSDLVRPSNLPRNPHWLDAPGPEISPIELRCLNGRISQKLLIGSRYSVAQRKETAG
jgi:hypothetical protein